MSAAKYGHYTSQAGLLGILTKEILWATNIKFLNDEQEFQNALQMCEDIIAKPNPSFDKDRRFGEYLAKIKHQLGRLDLFKSDAIFTLAFSEETDLLGQWRGYCPANNGYCIVFDAEALHAATSVKLENCHLVKCVYDDAKKAAQIRKVFTDHWRKYQKVVDSAERKLVIENLVLEITLLASYFKHPSFKEEQEHRIVVVEPASGESIKFREGRSSLIPYIEIPAPRKLIRKIIVGPNANRTLAKRALETFLSNNFDAWILDVDVEHAKTPYRPW
jgi:DUF2971 family protein